MPRRPTNKPPLPPKARALRLLARREHSAQELQHKLQIRGVPEPEAADTVRRLAAEGWQSDARYVESLVRSRIARGYGPLRIAAELEAAGVDDRLIRTALSSVEVDWNVQAEALRQRRFAELPRSAADWQKQYRFLQNRGFDNGHIQAALRTEPNAD